MKQQTVATILTILVSLSPISVFADDIPDTDNARELVALLEQFLATVDSAATHDNFWAEDLVYTSSNGTRRGKAEIMAGFEQADDEPGDTDAAAALAAVTYGAEDIRIREYGDTATVAFRLVADMPATDAEAARQQSYFNTGTFVERDGRWQVVAWQATRIPEAEAGGDSGY